MTTVQDAVTRDVCQACERIAPNWPLDRSIAVNPWWGWADRPLPQAGASLGALCGAPATMGRAWYRAQWEAGHLRREHLREAVRRRSTAADAAQLEARVQGLVAALHDVDAPIEPLPLLAAVRDQQPAASGRAPWSEAVLHQLSQHCAAYFDRGQSVWRLDGRDSLWLSWREQLAQDLGIPWRRSRRDMRQVLSGLPAQPMEAIAHLLDALALPASARASYLGALLLSCNGWAAWCAWLRWQARQRDGDDDHLVQLLAVRLAWERLVSEDAPRPLADDVWRRAWLRADDHVDALAQRQRTDWLLQEAMEVAYQLPLARALTGVPRRASACSPRERPLLQAVFCIDVRSERMRRALESAGEGVQTHGFAGFFGLPLEYNPLGTAWRRPQLPGLLAPTLLVDETIEPAGAERASQPLSQVLAGRRRQALARQAHWNAWRQTPLSVFGFVEACGVLSAAKLLRASLPGDAPAPAIERTGVDGDVALRPRLQGADTRPRAAAELAFKVLRAMGLTGHWAPIVLLVGHGSSSANNPHAAGLACGACGGQSGEVNARVLAGLLNDLRVRRELAPMGIAIPEDTRFVPALHDTTTDDVRCFDLADVPQALQPPLARVQAWLDQASAQVRAERAPSLGLDPGSLAPVQLAQALRRRANDASEVRPEWGLAGNAAFVAAPRERTRGLVLEGRCFLHDYDWLRDPGGQVLDLIMSAPMVVAHWINLQYYASTVAPERFGSGNKVLHNVVGGTIGVFEGNGGDLRIGLPRQSVHDGESLRHEPLRLSVFIEAPRAMIETVLERREIVRHLVEHQWLHLMRLPGGPGPAERYADGRWLPCEA